MLIKSITKGYRTVEYHYSLEVEKFKTISFNKSYLVPIDSTPSMTFSPKQDSLENGSVTRSQNGSVAESRLSTLCCWEAANHTHD